MQIKTDVNIFTFKTVTVDWDEHSVVVNPPLK
jgi:hypothetical protein